MGRAVPSLSSPFFFLTLSLPLRFFLSSACHVSEVSCYKLRSVQQHDSPVLNMLVNLLPIESNVSLIEVVAVLSTLLLLRRRSERAERATQM